MKWNLQYWVRETEDRGCKTTLPLACVNVVCFFRGDNQVLKEITGDWQKDKEMQGGRKESKLLPWMQPYSWLALLQQSQREQYRKKNTQTLIGR